MNYKYILLLVIFSGIGLISTAQMKFVEGYIVNNNHQKTDCLIRNFGNAESSLKYEYQLKADKKIEKIELSKIEEFGVENEMKFVRELIKIDVAPKRITRLKDTVNRTKWEEGHGYLRILVEGKLASLYVYYDQGENLFYYKVGNSKIEPLIYKEYSLEMSPGIVEQTLTNKAYIGQLQQNMPCRDADEVKKVSYTKKDLVKYFINYHICKGVEHNDFKSTQTKKGSFRFKLGTNLNWIKMGAENNSDHLRIVFPEKSIQGFGAEAEYLLAFNNYKWSLFAESNYYSYQTDYSDNALNSDHDGYVVDYKTIEFPLGITYYLNINSNHRFFVRGAFVPHLILSSSYILFHSPYQYKFAPSSRMMFSVGYNYRRLAMEYRYYTTQDITQNLYKMGSDLSQSSLRLSFILFRTGKRK